MSSSQDHAEASSYGGGGRTARPLFALIPIGVLMVIVLAMMAEGVAVMTTPSSPVAGVDSVAQTTAPTSGPGTPTQG